MWKPSGSSGRSRKKVGGARVPRSVVVALLYARATCSRRAMRLPAALGSANTLHLLSSLILLSHDLPEEIHQVGHQQGGLGPC